jgi:transcriptional regulator with PAS, ATPase and Fis domain
MKGTLSTIKQIVEALPSGVAVMDPGGIILTMNAVACRLLGISKLRAEGRPHAQVVPGSQLEGVMAHAKHHQYHLSLPTGSLRVSAVPILDENGKLCGAVEYYEEWGKLEALSLEVEHLKEENRFLDSILDAAHEFVAAVDSDGLITYMSEATASRMGVDRSTVIGQPMKKIRSDCLLPRVVRTGVAQMGELWKVHDASVPVMVLPLVRDGRIEGAVGKSVFRNMEEARVFLRRFESECGGSERVERKSRYVFDDIVGASEALVQAKVLAQKAASGENTVLLLAESGCGKELFAHALHDASHRRNGPFVSINCSCIPESLLESELFGYEEGAFTGARKGGRPGKFELAGGGTIFLDEIGDMSPFMEAKLLRVLQEGEIQKIGAQAPIKVDVRVIAATNADLRSKIALGEFRKDLYYRLEGISVRIPPLRERTGDVDLLIDHLLPRLANKAGKNITGMDPEVRFWLNQHDWPGNVRELVNVIEGTVCLASQSVITWKDVPPHFAERIRTGRTQEAAPLPRVEGSCQYVAAFPPISVDTGCGRLQELEKAALEEALLSTKGNKRRAALLLGMARSTFYEKLKRHGITACG